MGGTNARRLATLLAKRLHHLHELLGFIAIFADLLALVRSR